MMVTVRNVDIILIAGFDEDRKNEYTPAPSNEGPHPKIGEGNLKNTFASPSRRIEEIVGTTREASCGIACSATAPIYISAGRANAIGILRATRGLELVRTAAGTI
jgi:hypothetical protein